MNSQSNTEHPEHQSASEHQSALAAMHTPEMIEHRISAAKQHSYLGDFALGAVDGTVTTFAIVAGAAGAELSSGVAIVLGFANVAADGFSMAVSNYLKSRDDRQIVERFRKMEEMHIEQIPEGEREEIRQIFARKGFDGATLDEIVKVITQNRQQWVDTMLTEEWGLQLDSPSPIRAALTTFIAFVLAGVLPLLPLFLATWFVASQMFLASAIVTGLTFFSIGLIRGHVSDRKPIVVGMETLVIGGSAAALAFLVGVTLRGYAASS